MSLLYCGEANVCQDNLEGFLAIAEEFQLQGLTGQTNNDAEMGEEEATKTNSEFQSYNKEPSVSKYPRHPTADQSGQIIENKNHLQNGAVALLNSSAVDMQDLNENINTLMEKSSANGKKTFRCKVCGKEASHANNMKKHIEATHLDGVSIPCAQCEKTFRSINSLAVPIHKTHKTEK